MEINQYDPLADLYDTYVPAEFDIPFFLQETHHCRGRILELMSGTGRVSIPLLHAGHKLTCVDNSAEMNAVHRRKLTELGLAAEIITQDVCTLDLPEQYDMVLIPFHSFAHIVQPEGQRQVLARIRRCLVPGGTFICTLTNPAVRRAGVDGSLRLFRKYALPEDGGSLLLWIREAFQPADAQVVEAQQFFEEYDMRGTMKSRRLLELQFRLTEKDEFEALASAAGFTIKAFYGDYARAAFDPLRSPFMIWCME